MTATEVKRRQEEWFKNLQNKIDEAALKLSQEAKIDIKTASFIVNCFTELQLKLMYYR